jgi:hypothetical protein
MAEKSWKTKGNIKFGKIWIPSKLLLTAFAHPSKFYLFDDHIHKFKKELSFKTGS